MRLRAYDQYAAGLSVTTVLPTLDFETFSAAGYRWVPELDKWKSLAGLSEQKRGLEVVGVRNYVLHPTFDVTSLAYDLLDGNGLRHWKPPADLQPLKLCEVNPPGYSPTDYGPFGDPRHPWDLVRHVEAGEILEAWNVGFEFTVWQYFCARKWGWPHLRLSQLVCAMSKSRAHALPGALDAAGSVLNIQHQKDKDGTRLLRKFAVPRNPSKKDRRWRLLPSEDADDGHKLYAYNCTDVLAEIEASLRTPDLLPFEREIWLTDQAINQRGLAVDVQGIQNCIAIVEQAEAKYNAELRKLTASDPYPNGYVQEATEVEKIIQWLRCCGLHMSNLDDEAVTEALKIEHLHPYAKRVLRIRQMLAGAAVKKLYAFLHQQCDGRIHDLYGYFGARTGRWTAYGAQPMNLYKGFFAKTEKDPRSIEEQTDAALQIIAYRRLDLLEQAYPDHDALEVVASCIRGLIVAAPGHDLVCSDFSAIEGVVTAALAGEEWRLEVFRTHGMIYEASASLISGVPLADFIAHKKTTGQHHPLRNKLGKFAELASGFGGWIGAWKRFGADEHMTDEEIKRGILQWRKASPNIVELWGGQVRDRFEDTERPELFGLEGAIVAAITNPGQCYGYRGILYIVQADVLYCRVPSGGLITYHRPRLHTHNCNGERRNVMRSYEHCISYEGWNSNPQMGPVGWVRMDLYGGKATENVVQRVARDLQANALVRLEARGYRPVLHSHDEIAGEVPHGWGSITEFESIANELPDWARTADGRPWPARMKGGWRGYRYRKD